MEHVYEHYYPHSVPREPLTLEALDAIRGIHTKYIAAVAEVVGCSVNEIY